MKFDSSIHTCPRPPKSVSRFQSTTFIARPADEVLDFCLQGENFQKILPIEIQPAPDTDDLVGRAGHVYAFLLKVGPTRLRWEAYINEQSDRHFTDIMLRGPMRWWRHTHRAEPAPGGCLYTDEIEYRTRFGAGIDRLVTDGMMRRFFAYRHSQMKEMLEPSQPTS